MWKSVHSISASIKINVGGGGGGDNIAPDNNNTPDHAGAGGAASFGSYSIGASAAAGASAFTWEKLSPEEFQQLQDYAACKLEVRHFK